MKWNNGHKENNLLILIVSLEIHKEIGFNVLIFKYKGKYDGKDNNYLF